jgi:hypothetical protein
VAAGEESNPRQGKMTPWLSMVTSTQKAFLFMFERSSWVFSL